MRLTAEVMQAAGSCIMSTLSESSNRGGIGVGTCLALGVLRMNAWSENQCPEQHIVHLSPKLHIQKCDAKINGGGYSPLSPLVPTPMAGKELNTLIRVAYRGGHTGIPPLPKVSRPPPPPPQRILI